MLHLKLILEHALLLLDLLKLSLGLLSLLLEFLVLLLELLLHLFVSVTSLRLELSSNENLSSWFVIEHDGEPVLNSAVDNQGRHLDFGETNGITCCHILIPASQSELVGGTLNLKLYLVVPDGLLATFVVDWSLVLLTLECDSEIWGHLAQNFCVMSKFSLNELHG